METPGLSFMPATAAVAGSSPLRQELHEVRAQGPAVPDAKQPIPVHIQDLCLHQVVCSGFSASGEHISLTLYFKIGECTARTKL